MREALQREVWRYNNRSVVVATSPQLFVYDTIIDMSRQFQLSKSRTYIAAALQINEIISTRRRRTHNNVVVIDFAQYIQHKQKIECTETLNRTVRLSRPAKIYQEILN